MKQNDVMVEIPRPFGMGKIRIAVKVPDGYKTKIENATNGNNVDILIKIESEVDYEKVS